MNPRQEMDHWQYEIRKLTCLVCFSNAVSFSMAAWTFSYFAISLICGDLCIVSAYLGQLLSFGELFIDLLGEVLVRLGNLAFGHSGGCKGVGVRGWS